VSDSKAVISSGIYIQGQNLSEEEKQQETAKFIEWYETYMRAFGREPQKWD
jgi:hypothetical protein